MTRASETVSVHGVPDVDVDIRCGLWHEALPDVTQLCCQAAQAAAAFAGAGQTGLTGSEISVVLADDDFVQELNNSWRHQDSPTNVLAFPASDDETPATEIRMLGDVVVAFQTSAREANEQGKTLNSHLAHLIVHGVLHLMGYDHMTDDDAEQMEGLEITILSRMGIRNPYGDRSVET